MSIGIPAGQGHEVADEWAGTPARGAQEGASAKQQSWYAACAACYGIALAWAGVRIAARVAEPRLPELCQIALQSMA